MNEVKVFLSCPYGHTCERTDEQGIHRCVKYIPMEGTDRNTGEPTKEWNCTEVWEVVLNVEGNQFSRETGAAVESFRNEMVRENTKVTQAFLTANKIRMIGNDA